MRIIAGIVFAYLLFFAMGFVFRADTPSHFLLPAGSFLMTFYFLELFLKDAEDLLNKPFSRLLLLVLLLTVYGAAYYVGIYVFSYTYVLFGARWYDVAVLNKVFPYIPYWAALPGVLSAWAVSSFRGVRLRTILDRISLYRTSPGRGR